MSGSGQAIKRGRRESRAERGQDQAAPESGLTDQRTERSPARSSGAGGGARTDRQSCPAKRTRRQDRAGSVPVAGARMLARLMFVHLLGAWLLLSFFPGELGAQSIDDKPMKLCGREFVRAVISVCGRSRWKRVFMIQRSLQPEQEPEQMLVSRVNGVEGRTLDPEVIAGWKEGQIPLLNRHLGKNMLNLHGHTEDFTPTMEEFMLTSDESKKSVEKNKKEIKAAKPLRQYDSILGKRLWKKRDMMLSVYCCHMACTKSMIAKMC
ncbi:prorelaxin-like [Notamacropus eugenii]|uniref:prorelaxin-like n=1 Tax=Notamacropus eugenii TaxID=9315 RepID=UPI003B678E78